MFYIKICWWLELDFGPLVSEVNALPTEPQPLPNFISFCLWIFWFFRVFYAILYFLAWDK